MKKHAPLSLFMMLILSACSLPPEYDYSQEIPEKYFVEHEFDGRDWKVAYQASNEEQTAVEWTVNSEPIENWTELLTYQAFVLNPKFSAQQFAELSVNQLAPNSTDFKIAVIKDTPDDVIYEWSHNGDGNWPPQHEVVRIFRGKGGLYRLAYTVTKTAYDPELYTQWLENIKNAHLNLGTD